MAILDHTGRPWQRNGHTPRLDDDVARGLLGHTALPQVITFQAVLGSAWKAFWHGREDEAIRDSRPDAQAMMRDPFLMGLVKERIRAVTGLPWHLEGHDEKDPAQVELKDQVTAAIERTPDIANFLSGLMWAIWYGKYGQQIVPRWGTIKGRRTLHVEEWLPVHGDKIGHTWAGVPYVLANTAWVDGLPDAETFISTYGRGLLLRGRWRERFLIHKHDVLDGDFFDPESAGSIHGLGIRHWIYWFNWVRLEYMEWISTYLERVGLGLTLWMYDASNPTGKDEAEAAAREAGRRTNLLVPVWPESRGGGQVGGVERVETPVSGVDTLTALKESMEGVIERFIVGQSMSDGSDSEGSLGGTGRANFARDTKGQITREDARRLGETLTGRAGAPGLVRLIKDHSRPDMAHVDLRFVFDVEQPESQDKVSAAKTLFDMKVPLKADELRAAAGFSKPTEDDETVLQEEEQAPGGPGPEQMQREAELEQQGRQQELQHAQAKHEMELQHAQAKHEHDMRREQARTTFDQQQVQRKAALAHQAMQQKAALQAQQARQKAAMQAQAAQQSLQQRQQVQQARQQVAAYARGDGPEGVVSRLMALTPEEAGALRRAIRWAIRYEREWDEEAHPRDEEGKFGEAASGSKLKASRGKQRGGASGPEGVRPKGEVPRSKVAPPADAGKPSTPAEHARAVALAREKMAKAPLPTEQEVAEATAGLAKMGANRYRKGLVGNSGDRRRRRIALMTEFGDGETCPCIYCGVKVGEGSLEQDKIYTTAEGGRYRTPNLVPSCKSCNTRRSDMTFAEALETVVDHARLAT